MSGVLLGTLLWGQPANLSAEERAGAKSGSRDRLSSPEYSLSIGALISRWGLEDFFPDTLSGHIPPAKNFKDLSDLSAEDRNLEKYREKSESNEQFFDRLLYEQNLRIQYLRQKYGLPLKAPRELRSRLDLFRSFSGKNRGFGEGVSFRKRKTLPLPAPKAESREVENILQEKKDIFDRNRENRLRELDAIKEEILKLKKLNTRNLFLKNLPSLPPQEKPLSLREKVLLNQIRIKEMEKKVGTALPVLKEKPATEPAISENGKRGNNQEPEAKSKENRREEPKKTEIRRPAPAAPEVSPRPVPPVAEKKTLSVSPLRFENQKRMFRIEVE